MPKVSVIIPVYNTAPCLRRCLESVTGQTLRDIEIICVNDGSTDDSPAILSEYSRRDSRVLVIDFDENKGVSVARNAGLAVAQGEFIGFVDSDDYIDLWFYERLYEAAVNHGADIAKCNRRTTEIDGKITFMQPNRAIKENKFFFMMGFQAAIYNRAMLQKEDIRFPEGITNREDIVFLIKAVYWASNIITVDDAWYYCEKRPESASQSLNFQKVLESSVSAAGMIIDFLNSADIDPASYSHIVHKELKCIYRQGRGQGKNDEAVARCQRLFARCLHKELLLSSLSLPPVMAYLFKNGDRDGLAVYQSFGSKQSASFLVPKILRSSIRRRLK